MSRVVIGTITLALLAGCSEYRPVHQRSNESWQQAKQLAYRDDIAKHPVSQGSVGPRPFAIGPGQHLVMQGETVSELAEQYNIRQSEIVRLNRLNAPYPIYVGQILVLPTDADRQIAQTARRPSTAVAATQTAAVQTQSGQPRVFQQSDDVQVAELPAPTGVASAPSGPLGGSAVSRRPVIEIEDPIYPTHTVKQGESLAGIGEKYGYNLGEMLSVNQHVDPARLQAGQEIYIPDDDRAVFASRREPMDQATVAKIKQAAQTQPPALSSEGFLLPVDGQVIGRFGEHSDGTRNDGINIATAIGTPVKAAESGVVVFRGDNVGDFGRLLLVLHEDGFVTAYGHNSDLLVDVGDKVTRGETIARSGQSGGIDRPQLHFQIRKGSTPVDPRTRLAGASGLTQG